jgi:hypothetical protein
MDGIEEQIPKHLPEEESNHVSVLTTHIIQTVVMDQCMLRVLDRLRFKK